MACGLIGIVSLGHSGGRSQHGLALWEKATASVRQQVDETLQYPHACLPASNNRMMVSLVEAWRAHKLAGVACLLVVDVLESDLRAKH